MISSKLISSKQSDELKIIKGGARVPRPYLVSV